MATVMALLLHAVSHSSHILSTPELGSVAADGGW